MSYESRPVNFSTHRFIGHDKSFWSEKVLVWYMCMYVLCTQYTVDSNPYIRTLRTSVCDLCVRSGMCVAESANPKNVPPERKIDTPRKGKTPNRYPPKG